jgi:hypothetical protein
MYCMLSSCNQWCTENWDQCSSVMWFFFMIYMQWLSSVILHEWSAYCYLFVWKPVCPVWKPLCPVCALFSLETCMSSMCSDVPVLISLETCMSKKRLVCLYKLEIMWSVFSWNNRFLSDIIISDNCLWSFTPKEAFSISENAYALFTNYVSLFIDTRSICTYRNQSTFRSGLKTELTSSTNTITVLNNQDHN